MHTLAGSFDHDRGGASSAIPIHDPLLIRLTSRPELVAAILLATVSAALLLATPTFAADFNKKVWQDYDWDTHEVTPSDCK